MKARGADHTALQRLFPDQRASALRERGPRLRKDGNVFQISDARMEILAVRLDLWLRDCRRPVSFFRRRLFPPSSGNVGPPDEAPEQHWHQEFPSSLAKK